MNLFKQLRMNAGLENIRDCIIGEEVIIILNEQTADGYIAEAYRYGIGTDEENPFEYYLCGAGTITNEDLAELEAVCDITYIKPYNVAYESNGKTITSQIMANSEADAVRTIKAQYDGTNFRAERIFT